jgi:hypothetical protein
MPGQLNAQRDKTTLVSDAVASAACGMPVPRDTSVEPVLETGDGLREAKNPRVLTGVCSDGAAGEAEHNLPKIQPA